MTVEEMLYKWIPIQSTKHKWSPKTYTQSVAMVQNLIVPYIGKRFGTEEGKEPGIIRRYFG